MKKGSKAHWNDIWSRELRSLEEYRFDIAQAEKETMWRGIKAVLTEHYGTVNQLKVVELGAGAGSMSALMAKMVQKVTLIDYSEAALEKSNLFFDYLGITNVEYINADAFNLPDHLCNSYDVSMSFGLAEHFQNDDRKAIIKSHFDLLKPGGISFISVPNYWCLPYRIWKKKREFLKKWSVGLEIPYSRKEFKVICAQQNIIIHSFIGSSWLGSFSFIFPFSTWKRSIIKRLVKNYYQRIDLLRDEMSTPLDSYFGHSLVLCGIKKAPPAGAGTDCLGRS